MKTTIYLLLTFLFVTATSCEVDVPDMDRVPPKFSLQINGDGFRRTITETDDLSNVTLYIRKGTGFNFTLIGSDEGGLQDLIMIWEDDLLTRNGAIIPGGLQEGWYETNRYDQQVPRFEFYDHVDAIRFHGDASNAVTGAGVSGRMFFDSYRVEAYPNSIELVARDYGGLSGEPNITIQHLKIEIGDYTSGFVTAD